MLSIKTSIHVINVWVFSGIMHTGAIGCVRLMCFSEESNAACLRLEVAFQAPIGHELDDHQYWLAGSHYSEETHHVRMLELCQHVGLSQKVLTGAL